MKKYKQSRKKFFLSPRDLMQNYLQQCEILFPLAFVYECKMSYICPIYIVIDGNVNARNI